jgi:type IV pilus assembly protein PilW
MHLIAGFGLVELMVSIVLGMIVTAALIAIYIRIFQANTELERANRQMENGRFAIQMLRDELWHAGYWGEYALNPAPGGLTNPSAVVNPCQTWASWSSADKQNVFFIPVQGYDGSGPSCTGNRQTGTDVLVVRHADRCLAGSTGCEAQANDKLYLQVSRCESAGEMNHVSWDHHVIFGRVDDGTVFDRHMRDCTTTAGLRKFQSNIFYVRDYAVSAGDGIPTLVRSEFDESGGVVVANTAESLIEGIQNLQIEYALDTNGDGMPDGAYTSCSACSATQWSQIVATKLHILARNNEPTTGYVDTKTYTLAGNTVGPFNDAYKRHVFTATVRLVNPGGRK